jgi:anti-anti-sigma factor
MSDGYAPDRLAAPLRLSTHRTRNGTVRLTVGGEIDLATVTSLRDRLIATIHDDRTRRLMIDLRDVTFLDASGIAALTAALRVAGERQVDLVVVNCRRAVLRVLEITGVDKPLGAQSVDGARVNPDR